MKGIEDIKRDERAVAVARAHGRLERACQSVAAAVDAGIGQTPNQVEANNQLLVGLCVEYGRALNLDGGPS